MVLLARAGLENSGTAAVSNAAVVLVMSAGDHHPIREDRTQLLQSLLNDPQFVRAVQNYRTVDATKKIPFLGGSDNAGRKVFLDRDFAKAIQNGNVRYRGKSFDPTHLLGVHEGVEGALLRGEYGPQHGLPPGGLDYTQSHDIATAAERHAAEHLGLDFDRYQGALKPWIKKDEHEQDKGKTPDDLLSAPYQGTPQAGEVRGVNKDHPLIKQARKAPDGHHYVKLNGKYHMVVPVNGKAGAKSKESGVGAVPAASPQTRRVILVRHGATKMNNADVSVDRIRGWKDIPLSREGEQEAQRIGGELAQRPPDALVSSDLCRARKTAEAISQHTGVPLSVASEAFRPWNVGSFAGKQSKSAVPILAQYAHNRPDEPVPGGESFHDFRRRFFCGLSGALEKFPGRLAVVAHHRNERLLAAWKKAGFPPDGQINQQEFTRKGEPTGQCTPFDIPVDRLHAAAGALRKLPHKQVEYGPGHASGDHCAICAHFQSPQTGGTAHCDIVADPISPMGWCKMFVTSKRRFGS